MAFIPMFGTGWEHGIPNLSINLIGGGTLGTTIKKSGNYSLCVTNSNIPFTLPSQETELYFSLWWYCEVRYGETSSTYISLTLSDGTQLQIQYDGTYFYYYLGATLLGQSSHILNTGSWYNIKVRYLVDDASGVFQIKIDGVTDFTYTGDTKPTTATTITKLVFNATGKNVYDQHSYIYIDDLIVGTGGWPDDVRFLALKPNNSVTSEFLPSVSGAANYTLVDETPMSSSDYVYTIESGTRDLYEIEDFVSSAGIINYIPQYVVQWAYVKKDPTNEQKFRFVQKYGDAEFVSSGIEVSTNYLPYFILRTVNPSGTAWDDNSLDNLLIGQESII